MPRTPGRVVIVGAGLAGLRTLEQLRSLGYRGRITLIGDELHLPYDRPPLSKQLITGAWSPERTSLTDRAELDRLDVTCHFGTAAVSLDDTTVTLADGTKVTGDVVVIATGARARRLPEQPDGVHMLRTLDDAIALGAALDHARSLLIVGAGFIGAEVASAARDRGLDVTVVEAQEAPFARVLGELGGAVCRELLESSGANLLCGRTLARFDDAHTVRLADGTVLTGDTVVVGIGATPATSWLTESSLEITDGVRCGPTGRAVGAANIWAVGDVASWQHPVDGHHVRHEHWTNATDQAATVAADILDEKPGPDEPPYFWSDQFGLKIQLAGRPDAAQETAILHRGTPVSGTTLGYFSRGTLVAVATFGAPRLFAKYRRLVDKVDSHAAALNLKANIDRIQASPIEAGRAYTDNVFLQEQR